MSYLLRLLLIGLGVWTLMRVLFPKRGTAPAPGRPRPTHRRPGEGVRLEGRMVRDPICGTHLPAERALTLTDGNGTHYFCGSDCRDRHLAALRQRETVS